MVKSVDKQSFTIVIITIMHVQVVFVILFCYYTAISMSRQHELNPAL